jgi:hypothetical protein
MPADVARHSDVTAINSLPALRDFLNRLREHWDDDPEVAHGLEDGLKSRTLRLVVDGHPDAVEIAREVLAMDEWQVRRWYA